MTRTSRSCLPRASIRNIVEFEQDYPDARTILLERNYRSTQTIPSAANAVIARNEGRRPTRLWTESGDGAPIVGYVGDNEHDEASFVARTIDRLGDEHGVKPGDVAVFYRTNAQSRALEEVFVRVGLPYKVVGGTRFTSGARSGRPGLPEGPVQPGRHGQPAADHQRAQARHRRPRRGLHRSARRPRTHHLRRGAGSARGRPGIATRSVTCIKGFTALLEELGAIRDSDDLGVADLLEAVIERSGYLAELRASHDPQDETRVENLAEPSLLSRGEFDDARAETGEVAPLEDFLEQVSLVADADEIPDAPDAEGAEIADRGS